MPEFVLDTSVIVAMVLQEQGAEQFAQALSDAKHIYMCAGTALECELVLLKKCSIAVEEGEFWSVFQNRTELRIMDFDRYRLNIAKQALREFGAGKHRLNYGDCYAYSLAKTMGLQLLFKGSDFPATDVKIHPASVITV
jgi:ribonuclease VapC